MLKQRDTTMYLNHTSIFFVQDAEVELDEEELDLLKNMDRQMNEEDGIEEEDDDQAFVGNKTNFK